jgi:hypothetical protein
MASSYECKRILLLSDTAEIMRAEESAYIHRMMPWLKHHNSKYLSGVLYEKHVLNEKHCMSACLPYNAP